MAVTDAELETFARAGLQAAEHMFWEHGQSPNAVIFFNEAGEPSFVEYGGPADRRRVAMTAILHEATSAVMVGESWFRQMTPEQQARREPNGYLGDDPEAREQLFAMSVRAEDTRSFMTSKEILRRDGGEVVLEPLAEGWEEKLSSSWLRAALRGVSGPEADWLRGVYQAWRADEARRVVDEGWGG